MSATLSAIHTPPFRPNNVRFVGRGGVGITDSKPSEALAKITDEAANNPYAVFVAPGDYEDNVVCRRHIHLRSLGSGFGPNKDVVIWSSSGDTIQVPHRDSSVNGISFQSESGSTSETAFRIIDDGLGPGLETFCSFMHAESRSGANARAIIADALPPNENAILLWAGIDAHAACPVCMELNSFLVWFLGGMGAGAQTGCLINAGGGLMAGAQAGLNGDVTSGRALDMTGGAAFLLDCTIDGFNGIRAQGGSTLLLAKSASFGGIPNNPLDTDITSMTFFGSSSLEGFAGSPWSGCTVLGPTMRIWTGCEGIGTTGLGGPDQRPTAGGSNPPTGYRFTALDITVGAPGVPGPGGDLTYIQAVGWIDGTGAIHP